MVDDGIIWKVSDFDALDLQVFYQLLRERVAVFVVEQNCPYQDLDELDLESRHLWAESVDGVILSYARIVPPGKNYREPSIGRVLTSKAGRSRGLGRELMRRALEECLHQYPDAAVRISAQHYLLDFYSGLGFETVRGPYLEDGIPHIEMLRSAD